MNGVGNGYYRDDQWDEVSRASSSAYDRDRMSPYRSDPRGHSTASNGYSSDNGSVVSTEDGPTYVLEHLATFRVSPESDLVFPADGMRRLLHMEKTSGIWTQKMLLRLDKKWVCIQSHENGDTVEKFPMELIREPTAFTSDDPKELYNNIFIFVVAEDPKRNYQNPTEMHIFQCLRVSAKDVVEDVKLYMSGKGISGRGRAVRAGRGEHIPPPPQEPAPEPPLANGYRADFSDSEVRGEARGPRSERSSVSHNDDISSTSSEKYERDVAILNSCFDDIERFIGRLQHTAAATKELERRRRSRKSKKKDIGDGLLSMRAKPPPEREFVDIFQKFKLSFNLLAKLKAHIHDPNAPELVHFLFTPLAIIVDASRDSNYGSNLPSKVLSPLLTADAMDLLTNCLTSRETELWHSLGDTWCIPRNMWKYNVPPYQPVFSNGWAPELLEDSRDRSSVLASEVASEAKRTRAEEIRNAQREAEMRQGRLRGDDYGSDFYDSDRREPSPTPGRYYPRDERPRSMTPPSEYPQAGRSDISQDSMDQPTFEKHQRQWLNELKARGAKIVQVTYPRTANNDKELTVVRGEYLEVMDDSRKWWKAVNARGQVAHVPHTIVTPYSADQDGKEDYRADVRRNAPPPVWKERQGKKDYPNVDSSDEDDPSARKKSSPHKSTIIPVPPPPPPPGFAPDETVSRVPSKPRPKNADQMYGTTKSSADLMNAELKLVLESFRRQRPHLDIVKTPDVYISQQSSPEEVQSWLKIKGFSKRIMKQFEGVDGEKLFALDKSKLLEFCGPSEGARLASQITVQRNVAGYKTARSSELRQILARQRNKVDIEGKAIVKEDQETQQEAQQEAQQTRQQQQYDNKSKVEKIEKSFEFLEVYDKSDYQTDSDSEEEADSRGNRGTNTLKEQIKKQRKKIIGQSFDDKASR
ncbi:epidermal growth factor receptor kinase substrate 8 isoform X2 [Procambarus clarkii]|uniref:epidermal growth factor receptor kinase substrate 8 isoform X2 n=1 Tax=Procambarus clarkii TaxID=6728 RepID=UPI001E6705FF|nr:epidermal growth factor receptor kinase substrate 8-like isoform X2 [Procambarus clarkii]XP_045605620.1 epidermal growth factor receptor kinase substrate 8-like isoform X2 [Procambarus clarkii]XP_045605621.1 epidermal growth factor receptor kinase substrate 8-like isoform X2 [Procambarus clarkii]XP_045605622.1 epidermal growth factor receptor kinase substrate 8-like isoform X2 [Procambarus clarkii]